MKRICILLTAMLTSMAVSAHEGKPFVSASLGTQGSDAAFHGIATSVCLGYNLKGVDLGLDFDYFGRNRGWVVLPQTAIPTASGSSVMAQTTLKRKDKAFTARFIVAYDPLRFVRGNWRHHLRPALGLGFSRKNKTIEGTTTAGPSFARQTQKYKYTGFELTLGLGYDFNITQQWSVGAYYEAFVLERDQSVLGLRARYAF